MFLCDEHMDDNVATYTYIIYLCGTISVEVLMITQVMNIKLVHRQSMRTAKHTTYIKQSVLLTCTMTLYLLINQPLIELRGKFFIKILTINVTRTHIP